MAGGIKPSESVSKSIKVANGDKKLIKNLIFHKQWFCCENVRYIFWQKNNLVIYLEKNGSAEGKIFMNILTGPELRLEGHATGQFCW